MIVERAPCRACRRRVRFPRMHSQSRRRLRAMGVSEVSSGLVLVKIQADVPF